MNSLLQLKTIRPLLITLTLICFALLPSLKAADCPTACGSGGNTAVGVNALDSVTTGTNNTAVGTGALTDDTTGPANVAVGNGALAKNTTGQQNMAVGRTRSPPTSTATSTCHWFSSALFERTRRPEHRSWRCLAQS